MAPNVNVIPAEDPRGKNFRWAVTSRGADSAYVTITCIDLNAKTPDEPLGTIIEKLKIPREVVGMLAMALVYDDMLSTDAGESGENSANT